ncbi:hypothetical protein F0562_011346 [Nyssa sinensis]|uniref:MULE transposase domain-containing protein n=1 Tax=Nyssa sinensis TaxID=561372 RepID=A0A5J5A4R0_9ASTE|nr:hypothetical protein F0562_011346 [Nyssa sinensis]
MSLDAIEAELQEKFGVEAERMQLYRARRKALDEIEGSYGKSYSMLRMYANEIRKSNPGSVAVIECDRMHPNVDPTFKRMFIAFKGLVKGFKLGCRPLIGIDGCRLKGPYGGVLLSVVALDRNNGLLPVAFVVVESEGRESWAFFLNNLSTIIGSYASNRLWAFMSDKEWEISAIPCKNATAAIAYKRGNFEDYYDVAFMKETYLATHSGMIHLIVDEKMWTAIDGDLIQPPPLRRLPGSSVSESCIWISLQINGGIDCCSSVCSEHYLPCLESGSL